MSPARHFAAERAAWGIGLFVLWAVGYFSVGNAAVALPARDLGTPLDRAVPFFGWSVWVYLAGLPMMAAPLFGLRCPDLLRRTAQAYTRVIAASLACFVLFPSTSASLRADADPDGIDPVSGWVLRMLHAIDPPTNLFPSLHVSLCALAAFSMAEATPRARPAWLACLALVAVSTCTLKQHVLADVLGGLALALAAGRAR